MRDEYRNITEAMRRPDFLVLRKETSSGHEGFDENIIEFWEKFRPKAKDFKGFVPDDQTRKDRARLEELNGKFDFKTRVGELFGYCAMEGIGNNDWFGENCDVVPAHEFDDVVNGTDLIACFKREGGPSIKLAIDVTISEVVPELKRKRDRIIGDLRKGRMHPIKYFCLRDEHDEPRGEILMPKVIIGTTREEAEKLFEDFCQVLDEKGTEAQDISKSIFQRELLRQIRHQLGVFLEVGIQSLIENNRQKKSPIFLELESYFEKIRSLTPDQEVGSREYQELADFLKRNKEELIALEKEGGQTATDYCGTIYKHLEVLEVIDTIDKEKSSQGIELPPEARNQTERQLEVLDKEELFV